MRRLIRAFAGRTYQLVGNIMSMLNYIIVADFCYQNMAGQLEANTIVNHNSLEKASPTLHHMTVGADFTDTFLRASREG